MKKRFYFLLIIIGIATSVRGQNFVANPSVEIPPEVHDTACWMCFKYYDFNPGKVKHITDISGWKLSTSAPFAFVKCMEKSGNPLANNWHFINAINPHGDTTSEYYLEGANQVKGGLPYHGLSGFCLNYNYWLEQDENLRVHQASKVVGDLERQVIKGRKYFFSVWLSPTYTDNVIKSEKVNRLFFHENYIVSSFAMDLWTDDYYDSVKQVKLFYNVPGISTTTVHNPKNNIITGNKDSNWVELRMPFIANKTTDIFSFGYYSKWDEDSIPIGINPFFTVDTFPHENRLLYPYIKYYADAFTLMPYPELGDTIYLTRGDSLLLNPHTPEGDLRWDDGTIDTARKIYCPGTYWVESSEEFTSIRDSVVVLFRELRQIDTTLCQPEAVFSLGHSAYNIRWNTGETTYRIFPEQEGVYSVDYLLPGGCSISREVNIAFDTLRFPVISDTAFCTSGKLNFEPHKNHTYRWPDGSSNPEITITKAGDYSLQINTPHCHDSIIIYVGIESPEVLKYTDTTLCLEDSFVFAPDLPYDWAWLTEEQTSFTDSSDIIISWQQPLCGAQTDTFRLRFENCGCEAYIANAFSPNGDGLNEGFKPVIACELLEYEFWVYNRWGQQVFHSLDKNAAWQGTDLPVDAYYYLLSYRTAATRKPVFTHGFVQVTK